MRGAFPPANPPPPSTGPSPTENPAQTTLDFHPIYATIPLVAQGMGAGVTAMCGWSLIVKRNADMRERLLRALLDCAKKSGQMKPRVLRSTLCKRLGVSAAEFNVARSQLGDRYCHAVNPQDGEPRYVIHVSKCLELSDQLKRHTQLVRLAVLVAILGAVLAVALTRWL